MAASRHDHSSVASILHAGGILDQLPDGVALLNPELRILWCSRLLYEFTVRNDSGRSPGHAWRRTRLLSPLKRKAPGRRTIRLQQHSPMRCAVVGKTFLRSVRHARDHRARFLSPPHGLGLGRVGQEQPAGGGKDVLRSPGAPGRAAGDRKSKPAPGHRARYFGRGAAAAEAQRDLPGRLGAGGSVARRHHADERRRADRPVEVEDPSLHAGSLAVRDGRDPLARQVHQAVGAAPGGGDGTSGRQAASYRCGPIHRATA